MLVRLRNLRRGASRTVFSHYLAPAMGVAPSPTAPEELALLKRSLRMMESWLAESPYIAGTAVPTIADLRCAPRHKCVSLPCSVGASRPLQGRVSQCTSFCSWLLHRFTAHALELQFVVLQFVLLSLCRIFPMYLVPLSVVLLFTAHCC